MTFDEFTIWYETKRKMTSSALTIFLMMVSDLVAVLLSFGAGFFIVNLIDGELINFKSFVTYWPYLPVFLLFFGGFGLYPGISLAPSEELRRFSTGTFLAHVCIIVTNYIIEGAFDPVTAAFGVSFMFSAWILLLCRSLMSHFMSLTHIGGVPVVVYGSGRIGKRLTKQLLSRRWTGYMPMVILDNDDESGDFYESVPIIHDLHAGADIVRAFHIRMAIVAIDNLSGENLTTLYDDSVSAFRYSIFVPTNISVLNIWMSMRDFDGILGFATAHRLQMRWNLAIKRAMDLLIVIAGGLVTLPLSLFLALLVKITSPGPVLYGHLRVGKNGKPFKLYKFRTMCLDAEERLAALLAEHPEYREEWELNRKLKNDPRVTRFGKFLRRTSLDEVPQILNILRGEMSLVGPRPVTAEEKANYGKGFDRIFSVLPGISGLWQVSGRSEKTYEERVAYDTYYLQSWSIWLDLWVLSKTFGVVVWRTGAY